MDATSAPAPARVWKIYKITGPTGKVYIGQTGKSLEQRFSEHCLPKSTCTKLRNAIQKHGSSQFSIEQLASCLSKVGADDVERALIVAYDSVENGFNISYGGGGVSKLTCIRGHVLAGESCQPCRRVRQRELQRREPERFRAKSRKWRADNPERRKFHDQNKYLKFRDQILEDRHEYYAANRSHILAQKAEYREKNRTLINKKARNRKRRARLSTIFQDFDMAVFRG